MSQSNNTSSSSFFNARLTSIFSVSLVLFLLGLLATNFLMAHRLSSFVKEHISFSIVVKDEMKEADIIKFQKRLDTAPFVKSTEFISKEQALKYLIDELGDDPKEFLGYNPLYASIEVYLKSEYANSDSIALIEKHIRTQTNVREVIYRRDLIDLVNENINKVGMILAALAAVLMLISFALISNTIRLSIYSKRFLINTMKLVGATPSFIRKPFVRANIVNGVVAALVAICMLFGLIYYLTLQIDNFVSIITTEDLIVVVCIVLILGIIISAISAHFAVNKYLRMKTDKLYYV